MTLHAQSFQVFHGVRSPLALVPFVMRDGPWLDPSPAFYTMPAISLVCGSVQGDQLLTFEPDGFVFREHHENPTTLSSSSLVILSPHVPTKTSMQSEKTRRNSASSILSNAMESASKITFPAGVLIVV